MTDEEAWKILDPNFKDNSGGIIIARNPPYTPTKEENRAIDYLCEEWDYGYHILSHPSDQVPK